MRLYLDTSHFLAIGVLDEACQWQHYEFHQQLQHAGDIHARIHNILNDAGAEAKDLEAVIICNGPGSYTGIRLGEGIAQLFELSNIPVYSFHQYEIPKLLGHQNGRWVCHAFKGEIFQYSWQGDQANGELIAASDWQHTPDAPLFTHQPQGPWQEQAFTLTTKLVEESPGAVLATVMAQSWRREPYYFRPLDKEFKRSVV